MSTRSTITYYNKSSKRYYTVYCHYDGYLGGVGLMLYDNYKDYDKVKRLVSLGGMSCLEPNIDPAPGEPHSFEKPQKDVCVFYTRDRGEDWEHNQPRASTSLSDVLNYAQEFNYLFKDGKWLVCTLSSWVPLEQELLAHNLIKNDPNTVIEENVNNSVDTASKNDFVSAVKTVDQKIPKFVELLNTMSFCTNSDIGDSCYDSATNTVRISMEYVDDCSYVWDDVWFDFLKQLLDIAGLEVDSFEITIKDNHSRYCSLVGIRSK